MCVNTSRHILLRILRLLRLLVPPPPPAGVPPETPPHSPPPPPPSPRSTSSSSSAPSNASSAAAVSAAHEQMCRGRQERLGTFSLPSFEPLRHIYIRFDTSASCHSGKSWGTKDLERHDQVFLVPHNYHINMWLVKRRLLNWRIHQHTSIPTSLFVAAPALSRDITTACVTSQLTPIAFRPRRTLKYLAK